MGNFELEVLTKNVSQGKSVTKILQAESTSFSLGTSAVAMLAFRRLSFDHFHVFSTTSYTIRRALQMSLTFLQGSSSV